MRAFLFSSEAQPNLGETRVRANERNEKMKRCHPFARRMRRAKASVDGAQRGRGRSVRVCERDAALRGVNVCLLRPKQANKGLLRRKCPWNRRSMGTFADSM